MDVSTIILKIGWRPLAERLQVTRTAVLNARTQGSFPAAWYQVVQRLCDERGIDCPPDLFNWKKDGDDA